MRAQAVCLLGKERREPVSCLPSPSAHCCMRTHTCTHTFSAMAAGSGDGGRRGGGGGSKIKLKIKACPESPSARRGPAGRGGGLQQLPLHRSQVWGPLSVCPASYWAPAWPCSPGPAGPLLPSVDQRSMGPGGRQGQGEIKGAPRDGHWDGNRDAETEMWRQRWRQETEGCGDKDVGRRDMETQRHKRAVWRQGDVGTQGRGAVDPDSRGRDPVPVGPAGQRWEQGRGRQRWRDAETV